MTQSTALPILLLTYPWHRWNKPYHFENPEFREKVLTAILSEGDIRKACAACGIHYSTMYRYAAKNKEFAAELQATCEQLYHYLRFDAVRIADEGRKESARAHKAKEERDPYEAQHVRNQMDARLRVAGQHKPASVEVNLDNRVQTVNINDPERAKLIAELEAARARALNNKPDNNKKE